MEIILTFCATYMQFYEIFILKAVCVRMQSGRIYFYDVPDYLGFVLHFAISVIRPPGIGAPVCRMLQLAFCMNDELYEKETVFTAFMKIKTCVVKETADCKDRYR